MSAKRKSTFPPDGFKANPKAARLLEELVDSGDVDQMEPREVIQRFPTLQPVSLKNVRDRLLRLRKAKEKRQIGALLLILFVMIFYLCSTSGTCFRTYEI